MLYLFCMKYQTIKMLFTFNKQRCLVYLIVSLLIAFSHSYTSFSTCHCKICDKNSTVGIEYRNRCYFIEVARSSNTYNRPTLKPPPYTIFGQPPAEYLWKQTLINGKIWSVIRVPDQSQDPRSYTDVLTIVNTLTRHFNKMFNHTEVVIDLDDLKKVKTSIIIPSYDYDNLACPVYDIRNNLIYDGKRHCFLLEKVYISSEYTADSAYQFTFDAYSPPAEHRKSKEDYYPCFKNQRTTTCVYMQHKSYECSQLFQVIDQKTYDIMEKYAIYKTGSNFYTGTNKAFLVYYDSSRYQLKQRDYYMEVLTHKTRRPKGNCYIADVLAGRLFQQTSCKKAIANLRAKYFNNGPVYTSMCADPVKQSDFDQSYNDSNGTDVTNSSQIEIETSTKTHDVFFLLRPKVDIKSTTDNNEFSSIVTTTASTNSKGKSYSVHIVLGISVAILSIIFLIILLLQWKKRRQYVE